MEFRKDSEVADWALDGAKPLGRPLQTWEREALRRKRRSLMRAATEMESMAMSGTASPRMAKVREETARKYRDQIAELEKVMARFKILEGRKMRVTKRQLKRIIREEKQKLLREDAGALDSARAELEFALDEFIEANVLAGVTDAQAVRYDAMGILDKLIDDHWARTGKPDLSRYRE